jgi:hypothetical protein
MGILVLAVASLLVLAGCYSPSLRDCTVSCVAESDCAAGQICGDDGLCASPDRAGRCALQQPLPPDASIDARSEDAPLPRDAAASDASPPDAPPSVALRVQIIGRGSVLVTGHPPCLSSGPQHGDCMYDIARGVPQNVVAVAMPDQPFMSWTSATCRGQGASCTFTPTAATSVAAKFGRGGPD